MMLTKGLAAIGVAVAVAGAPAWTGTQARTGEQAWTDVRASTSAPERTDAQALENASANAAAQPGAQALTSAPTWTDAQAAGDAPDTIARVEAYLDSVRHEPGRLGEFVADLPKGADLHTHLSGAVPTGYLLNSAVRGDLCVDTASLTASAPPCRDGQRPARDAVTDPRFADDIVRAWSMRGFTPGKESGHDHFFSAFGRFGAATSDKGEMLALLAARAAAQQEFTLEVMLSRQSGAVQDLVKKAGGSASDLAGLRDRLLADGAMAGIVKAARADADTDIARMRKDLRCDDGDADPGCALPLRFLLQVTRTAPPEVVFAQMLLGFELAKADERYVGVNLVAPEDDPVALRDYRLHMRMLDYLRGLYPEAHISLHAGELTPGLAPDADLRFHIREAVKTGHAERIGHGASIGGEDDPAGLMADMARGHVLVEIALTSNCQILKVCDDAHPFAEYRRAGVPVALVTDDAGIEHTDLNGEYLRAITQYGLRYADLKTLARTALDHSFLQGASLWRAPDDHTPVPECAGSPLGGEPAPSCLAVLKKSPKAAAEWRQEGAFTAFEDRYDG